MSKRFGRQQKRKMRDRLAREQNANRVLRDNYQRAIDFSKHLSEYLVNVFGGDHILFGLREITETAETTIRHYFARTTSANVSNSLMAMPIELRYVTLHRLCMWLNKQDSSWDKTKKDIALKMEFKGGSADLYITEELLNHAPLSMVQEMVSGSVASLLLEFKNRNGA